MLLTRAPGFHTPANASTSKNTHRHEPSLESRGQQGDACAPSSWLHTEGDRQGGHGTIQAPLHIDEVGNWQVPVQGDYLRSGRIQSSDVRLRSLCFHPFPKAKPSEELLLPHITALNGPAPVPHPFHWLPILSNLPGDTRGDKGPH